jgi:hypothetical protein
MLTHSATIYNNCIRQAICELNLSTVDVFLDPATRDGLRCSLEQQALPEVELAVFRRLHLDQRREELESFFLSQNFGTAR